MHFTWFNELFICRQTTYESTKLLKILLVLLLPPPLVVLRLLALEPNAIEMGDVVSDRGPPTSIGESALGGIGLPPECWDVLKRSQEIDLIFAFISTLQWETVLTSNLVTPNRHYLSTISTSIDDYSFALLTIVDAPNQNRYVDFAVVRSNSDVHLRCRRLCLAMIHDSVQSYLSWLAYSHRSLVSVALPWDARLYAIWHDDSGTKPIWGESKKEERITNCVNCDIAQHCDPREENSITKVCD